ncbi:MAG: DUF4166 domain-containing protein [Reyranella sp.]|nr:DUF4166 domain-containing protein [Reyranella sp.]
MRLPIPWESPFDSYFKLDALVQVGDERLTLSMVGMSCGGLPLPRALWPVIEATETEEEGRFRFDVLIGLPFIGRLVRYRGWLADR